MARGLTSILGLLLIGLSIVFAFFVILSGVSNTTPLNRTYFLEADTSGLSGAKSLTRWTYLHFCGDNNLDCTSARPAPAFGRAWDSDGADDAPDGLGGGRAGDTTSTYYYFMWRFGWVFYLMALAFSVFAFFGAFLSCCGRIGSFISSSMAVMSLFFWTLAAVLMTVTFTKARNAFKDDGRDAKLGAYAFGFTWGAWAATLLATVLFCMGIRKPKSERRASPGGKRSFFGRRGSERVKGEYA